MALLGSSLRGTELGGLGSIFSQRLFHQSLLLPESQNNNINPAYRAVDNPAWTRFGDLFTEHARLQLVHPQGVSLDSAQNFHDDCVNIVLHCTVAIPADNRETSNRYTIERVRRSMTIPRAQFEDTSNREQLHALIRRYVETLVTRLREDFESWHGPTPNFQQSREIVRRELDARNWREIQIGRRNPEYQYRRQYQAQQQALEYQRVASAQCQAQAMGQAMHETLQGLAAQAMSNFPQQEEFLRQYANAPWPEDFAGHAGLIHPGEKKALQTLGELIGEDELKIYEDTGNLFVEGEQHFYIIPKEGMVLKLGKYQGANGKWKLPTHGRRLCIAIQRKLHYPPTDNVIALKLMIENHEKKFLNKANRFERTALEPFYKRAACMERSLSKWNCNLSPIGKYESLIHSMGVLS